MGFDDICKSDLVLGLGWSSTTANFKIGDEDDDQKPNKERLKLGSVLEPISLTLSLPGESYDHHQLVKKVDAIKSANLYRHQDGASVSSFSINGSYVKREREIRSEGETQRVSSKVSDEDDDDDNNGRKKLRLSKYQSALLEEYFKEHITLNPKKKQELAKELKLKPRQVEVWFQNRRARTKLKQTEADRELLKKCCEALTDENRRLQKEVKELKAVKMSQTFCMQLPAATLTMCPSCERIGGGGVNEKNKSKSTLTIMAPNPHFYNNPFPNPSAAC